MMSDLDFELRVQRVLRADSERAVRPFDAVALAVGAASTRRTTQIDWRPIGWPVIRPLILLALLTLLATAVVWLIGAGRHAAPDGLVDSTAGPVVAGSMSATLSGPWIADRPASLSFGDGAASPRISLFVDGAGSYVFVAAPDLSAEHLPSDARMDGASNVRFTSRSESTPIQIDGATVRGCRAGETGTYRLARSADGLRITLELVDDPCPSRASVFARTWIRSLGLPNSGGAGVVDAFDPLFTVEIPPGAFLTDRTADHLGVLQIVPEFQFTAWKNPQGWNDACDRSKGRYPIAPGAEAFVAYFRQLEGFTVDSTSELEVDGHHAVRLALHANADACPQPWEFQPKAESDTTSWFLRPGDADSLVVVELADDTTLLFEVLPAPNGQEAQVLESIRFLDRLPSSP